MTYSMRAARIATAPPTFSFIPSKAQALAYLEAAWLIERFLALVLQDPCWEICALCISMLDCLPQANRPSLA
jgi:hypothetical protein